MKLLLCLLFLVGCTSVPTPPVVKPIEIPKPEPTKPVEPVKPTEQVKPVGSLDAIKTIAGSSQCAKYQWKDRGLAPKAYIKGVALVFAKAVCSPKRDDVVVVSQAKTGDDVKDALSWYNSNFNSLGMKNDVAGVDTLRHAYTLLIGLGMRESSGKHCCGRDMSADFNTAESAEAGIFQSSWGAKRASPVLAPMFEKYKAAPNGCLLDVFKENVKCSTGDAKNWGDGNGYEWQKLTKECPAFSTEYAAVLLRTLGGTKGEFGPLRKKAAEIRPECDAMLLQVQKIVEEQPSLCELLK